MIAKAVSFHKRSAFSPSPRVARAPIGARAGASPVEARGWFRGSDEWLSFGLLAAAFAATQVLIGGTRLVFSLPGCGLLGALGVLALLWLRRSKVNPAQICVISSALFFGYILVRAIFSPAPYIARSDIYSVLGGLIVYFFVSFFFTSPKQRTAFWLFLLAIAIVHVGIGAVQFRGGQNFMPISFLQRGYDYGARASGFYICPNHLAGFLEVAGIFGLSIVCWSRWPVWSKMLIGYATAVCYFGIVLTGSRGGYLSTAASLIVFGALSLITLRRTTPRLFWTAGAAGALAALIVGLAALFLFHKSDYLSERAQNIIDKKNVRIDMWQAAVEQWKLQPFLGTGSGTYLYYGRQFRTERVQQDPVEVHNDYLQLLAEYGLVGTSLFVLFLIAHLHNGWKNFRRLGPGRVARSSRVLSNSFTLNVGAIAAVCAHIVHSFVDFNLHIPANVLLLALVFGSLANAGVRRETESSPTLALSPSLFRWRLALPIIGVVVLVQVVRLLPAEYLAEHARTAIRDDKADIAARFAERALKIDNQNPYLFQYLGAARLQQSALAKEPQTKIVLDLAALEAFTKARALAPRDKDFILAIASIYDALGRFNESEWLYSEALRLDPRSIYTKQGYDIHVEQWRDRGGLAQSDAVAPHS